MTDDRKRLCLIAAIIALMAFAVAIEALDTAGINNIFQPVVNNTNLGIGDSGNGERLPRVVYNATNYSRFLYLKFHIVNNNAAYVVNFTINGTVVAWDASTTVQANQNHSWPGIMIPIGSNYSYDNTSNIHHVEIYEYPVLAGKNGTLSINQTVVGGNASYPINAANGSQIINNNQSFWREFWQKQGTAVQGTWAWQTQSLQIDYSSVTGEGVGIWINAATNNDLDEYKWSNVYLSPGTYKITFTHITASNRGIVEWLYGTTSLGTVDEYSVAITYNVVNTVTFVVNSPTTADMRFRVNGKNGASSDHFVDFSRFQIEKTG